MIMMQVVCIFFLLQEKILKCKLIEVVLVYCIELVLSKDQIFEFYMNQIYFGQCIYGFVSVVCIYFKKCLLELMLVEVVMLVGLL